MTRELCSKNRSWPTGSENNAAPADIAAFNADWIAEGDDMTDDISFGLHHYSRLTEVKPF